MATFNLNDYETVEERIRRFYGDNPHGRIITRNLTTLQDRHVSTWVVEAQVLLPMFAVWDDAPAQENPDNSWFVKATGLAFEVDGGKGPNQTSALENCETSAIGRALANAGYSGNKRVTREEMAKVERGVTPAAAAPRELSVDERNELLAEIKAAVTKDSLRAIWAANKDVLDAVWHDEFDVPVSLKAHIMSRQSEIVE